MDGNGLGKKIARTFTGLLPIAKNRYGKCIRCGECCRLVFKCPFLRYKKGRAFCAIYKLRPWMCRVYPRTKKEHVTKETCGYKFK